MKANRCCTLFRVAALSIAASLVASGCSLPNAKQIDYKSTERSKDATLEIPPDMVNAPASSPVQASVRVLTPVSGMRIERADHAHWLVVDHKTPEQLWPQLREFWQAQGFTVSVEARARGIFETDWKTSQTHLNQGMIRNTLSKIERLGNAYMTSEKNKYLTRVFAKTDGRTWISIHHQGQHEVLTGTTKEISQWQPAPNDPGLEVEYLQRLMHALASEDAPKTPPRSEEHSAVAATAQSSEPIWKDQQIQKNSEVLAEAPAQIDLTAPFDHVWLQMGVALERANFTIVERDRVQGVYTLRYVGPSEPQAQQTGFWRQLFQKRNKDKQAQRYALKIQALSPATTRIFIADERGEADLSVTARRILALLAQRLR